MWQTFDFIDLFAGIGGIRLGFQSVGGNCVFSSEIDEDARKTYNAYFHDMPQGDITQIRSDNIPDFDVLLGGFPCQPFSIIGNQEGFNDETSGTLFFEIERILRDKRPPAFMLENVSNLKAHDHGNTYNVIENHLQALGYHVHSKVLNAIDFGVPQSRKRIIIVGFLDDVHFEFPTPVPENERRTLQDVLEEDVDRHYYVNPMIRDRRRALLRDPDYPRPYISHENVSGTITPHPFSAALRAGASANYILINDERRPTEREMLNLQGFPADFPAHVCSYSAVKKQCGNSVAVPMIEAVAREMQSALQRYYEVDVYDMTDFKKWLENTHQFNSSRLISDCISRIRRLQRELAPYARNGFSLANEYRSGRGQNLMDALSNGGATPQMLNYLPFEKLDNMLRNLPVIPPINLPIGNNVQMNVLRRALRKYYEYLRT